VKGGGSFPGEPDCRWGLFYLKGNRPQFALDFRLSFPYHLLHKKVLLKRGVSTGREDREEGARIRD
jgi:hypothetical protein